VTVASTLAATGLTDQFFSAAPAQLPVALENADL
jgi:hypothetical protein